MPDTLLEILKFFGTLLGGGLAGAILNEWLRRRNLRVQSIPLVERVNRLVSPQVEGLTLARVTEDGGERRLEEVSNVREYQFSLRNTSTIHLQNVEVQFEFPANDVEAWAERPSLSKTTPISVDPQLAEPWIKGYRWRIPQLPASDSIEFTFRAVNPSSDKYEVALYNSDRVVVEKSSDRGAKGEPKSVSLSTALNYLFAISILSSATFLSDIILGSGKKFSSIHDAGCTLSVETSYGQVEASPLFWQGPWRVDYRVMNYGLQPCVVRTGLLGSTSVTLDPGLDSSRTVFSKTRPHLATLTFTLGASLPATNVTVLGYVSDTP